jgi:hypothetical protein
VEKHEADRYTKKLSMSELLKIHLSAHITGRNSLSEMVCNPLKEEPELSGYLTAFSFVGQNMVSDDILSSCLAG